MTHSETIRHRRADVGPSDCPGELVEAGHTAVVLAPIGDHRGGPARLDLLTCRACGATLATLAGTVVLAYDRSRAAPKPLR